MSVDFEYQKGDQFHTIVNRIIGFVAFRYHRLSISYLRGCWWTNEKKKRERPENHMHE